MSKTDPNHPDNLTDDQKKYLLSKTKFDLQSMDYEKVDETIEGQCSCCHTTDKEKEIIYIRANDNTNKRQVAFRLCKECQPIFSNLPKEDPSNSRIQNLLKMMFGSKSEEVIKNQFYDRKSSEHDPIYIEYFAMLKWTVEEQMLLQLGDAPQIKDLPNTTVVHNENECILCKKAYESQIEIFSPIKKCWLLIDLCNECTKTFNKDRDDMEYEIRTLYTKNYDDFDNLPKRELVVIFGEKIKYYENKVLFLDPRFSIEHTTLLLHVAGCDKDNSVALQHEKEQELTDNDSSGINENENEN